MKQSNQYGAAKSSRGFSTLEVLLVMVVSLIIAMFAIPGFNQVQRTLRISGDARDLNGAINQAKMQAAASFTESRVYVDLMPLSLANPLAKYHIDIWNKAGNGGNGCWQVVGDLNNPCFVPGVSPVQYLSTGVSFGFAGLGAPPLNTQTNILQGPATNSCAPVNGKRVGQPATTACIQFNSRGIPIDINNGGVPTGNGAFYLTDNTQVYGVTVAATGLSQVWANNINGNGNGNNANGWYRK